MVLMTLLIVGSSATPAGATIEAGKSCPKVGKTVSFKHAKYRCVVVKSKRQWVRMSKPLVAAPAPRLGLDGTITVFAAASLTEVFNALGAAFTKSNPNAKVVFSFAGSSALATQINNGAPADVFASAAELNMRQVTETGRSAAPTVFASNAMMIAVPITNSARIESLADLARDGIKVAVCQPQVPCGSAAKQVFANSKVAVTPVTYEPDVKSVLTKVRLGEVDAGIVYRTDVNTSQGAVVGIEIPVDANVATRYPIALLRSSAAPTIANAFISFVLSDVGAVVLRNAGFTVL